MCRQNIMHIVEHVHMRAPYFRIINACMHKAHDTWSTETGKATSSWCSNLDEAGCATLAHDQPKLDRVKHRLGDQPRELSLR